MNAPAGNIERASAAGRPRSAVSGAVGMVGLAGFAAWVVIARRYGMEGPLAALAGLVACAAPMILWSFLVDKVHRRQDTGIDWEAAPRSLSQSLDVSFVKIAGLWATWAAIGAIYCLGRWYWTGSYLFAMEVLATAALPLLLASVPYVIWLDRRLREPRDGSWHFGRLVIGRPAGSDREKVYDYLRSWTVKGFFLAFMLSTLPGNWAEVVRSSWESVVADPVSLALWLIGTMYMVDVAFATIGYVLTLKPLDAHIRSANPYMSGWVAALICYPPFILMNAGGPLDYHQGTGEWTAWFANHPVLLAIIGFVLVVLTAIYAWATVAFGIRFSNLTHRGILTHGPYAWTKHPAYVSKNLFWWIATMPFFATTGSVADALRNTAVLAIVSGIYFWRAKTEEKHLMADPVYREYAAWMAEHGSVARLRRWLASSREPAAALPAE